MENVKRLIAFSLFLGLGMQAVAQPTNQPAPTETNVGHTIGNKAAEVLILGINAGAKIVNGITNLSTSTFTGFTQGMASGLMSTVWNNSVLCYPVLAGLGLATGKVVVDGYRKIIFNQIKDTFEGVVRTDTFFKEKLEDESAGNRLHLQWNKVDINQAEKSFAEAKLKELLTKLDKYVLWGSGLLGSADFSNLNFRAQNITSVEEFNTLKNDYYQVVNDHVSKKIFTGYWLAHGGPMFNTVFKDAAKLYIDIWLSLKTLNADRETRKKIIPTKFIII